MNKNKQTGQRIFYQGFHCLFMSFGWEKLPSKEDPGVGRLVKPLKPDNFQGQCGNFLEDAAYQQTYIVYAEYHLFQLDITPTIHPKR